MNTTFLAEQPTVNLDENLAKKLAQWFDNQEGFWSGEAVSGAIGGILAVSLYFLFRLFISWHRAKPKLIRKYSVANSLNRIALEGISGELQHGCGQRINSVERLNRLGVNDPVWEYRACDDESQVTHRPIFCGPHTTDFTTPGIYAAIFSLRADDIPDHAKSGEDLIVLELDVAKLTTEIIKTRPAPDGKDESVVFQQNSNLVARRFVRLSDLSDSKWIRIELTFYADGLGSWEYRAWPYDGRIGGRPNSVGNCGKEFTLYFDTVALESRPQMNIPDL